MITISDFDYISINGRCAFGIKSLEKVCEEWNLSSPLLTQLISTFWEFTSSNDLSVWQTKMNALLPDENPSDLVSRIGIKTLTPEQAEIFGNLVEAVLEIGTKNLYAGYRSEYTLRPLSRVLSLLEAISIDPPSIEVFSRSKSSERDGWGNSVPPSYFDDSI
jgi:hypothetical protein